MDSAGCTFAAYDDLGLLRLHVEAVWTLTIPPLSAHTGEAALAPCPEPPPWALYLAAVNGQQVHIWRHDVAPSERAQLQARGEAALAQRNPASDGAGVTCEVVLRLAAAAGRVARRIQPHERALLDAFEPGESAYYAAPERAPVIGAVANGVLVSVAHSARRTAQACELGVESRPAARRHGYGLAVTVLWTAAVAAEGRIPLYSALATNAASLALAAAAGYRPFARATQVAQHAGA